MSTFFDKNLLQVSDYPADFIPAKAITFIGIDWATDNDYTVKGFYKDGTWHIQQVEHQKNRNL